MVCVKRPVAGGWNRRPATDMCAMRSSALLAAAAAMIAAPVHAQPIRASYEVYAGGVAILQMEAEFDVTAEGYRLMTVARTRGIAAAFVPGQQAARVVGAWAGMAARPVAYGTDGVWRGRVRRTVLDWPAGDPVVVDLQPAEDEPRDEVPADIRRGSIDGLSALAQMSRLVARVGHCDGEAQVFDGRRRSDYASRTVGREMIQPWREAWHGTALRCAFEGRLVAGFRRGQRQADSTPQRGTAWVASPFAGAPPIPVRVEVPSRWFGQATAVMLRAEFSASPVQGQNPR